MDSARKQTGFTLVELIIVIVIAGIIAVGSTAFIVNSAKGLADVTRRDTLANSVRINTDKIERQLKNSIASSIRVTKKATQQCIEMLPIHARSFYTNIPLKKTSDQITTASLTANVIGMRAIIGKANESLFDTLKANNQGQLSSKIIEQKKQSSGLTTLSLSNSHRFINHHAQQIVRYVTQPISYCLENGNLYQYSEYGFKLKQPLPDKLPKKEPKRLLMAQGFLESSTFSYQAANKTATLIMGMGTDEEHLAINQKIWLNHE